MIQDNIGFLTESETVLGARSIDIDIATKKLEAEWDAYIEPGAADLFRRSGLAQDQLRSLVVGYVDEKKASLAVKTAEADAILSTQAKTRDTNSHILKVRSVGEQRRRLRELQKQERILREASDDLADSQLRAQALIPKIRVLQKDLGRFEWFPLKMQWRSTKVAVARWSIRALIISAAFMIAVGFDWLALLVQSATGNEYIEETHDMTLILVFAAQVFFFEPKLAKFANFQKWKAYARAVDAAKRSVAELGKMEERMQDIESILSRPLSEAA